jgi:hypothetical protein
MKHKRYAVAGGLVSLLASSVCCAIPFLGLAITGSGNVVSEEQDIADFDEVGVSHAFEVEISRSDAFRVVVHVDDNLREHISVVKRGRTLLIGLKRGERYRLRNATLQAEVAMPELAGIRLGGASDGTVTGFRSAKPLEVDASGASRLRGDIEAGDVRIRLSGASQAALMGAAEDLAVEGSGASQCDLSAFDVADAEIDLSGASAANVRLSGELRARLSGASSVTYTGGPTAVETKTSGASSVKRA